MGSRLAAAALLTAALAIASPASAAYLEPVPIDTAPTSVNDIGVAPDGSGALVYLKTVGSDDQVWASIMSGGAWAAPVRVDPDDGDDESAPRVAVGNGGRVLVGYRDANAQTLKSRLKQAGSATFDPEQVMRTGASANAINSDWDLDMNPAGVAYAAWAESNPGTLQRDLRAWRLEGTTATTSLRLQKDPNAESVNDGGNGPDVRVAVDGAGNGTVSFGQVEAGGDSFYLRRLTGLLGGAFVDVEVPSVLGESLSAATRQLDLDVAGNGLAWATGTAMYTAGGHAIGVPVIGELAGAPAVLDAYPASENDNVERPDVALNATGQGLFASEPNLKQGVFGGSIAGIAASPAQRLDTSPHDPDSEVPVAAIGDSGRGLIAWTRDVGDGADGPFQVVGRAWNGGAFEPETLLVDSAQTPFSLSSADGAGASRLGDVAVLTERDVGGTKSVVVGRYDAPPSVPAITSAAGAASFTWSASEAIWSPLTSYKVVIDGATVATLPAAALSYPAPSLPPGAHTWRVAAVDSLGQEASSATQALTIPGTDTNPPSSDAKPVISGLTQSKKRWHKGQGTKFRLTLSELSTLVVEFRKLGPGRKVKGRCVKPKPKLRKRPRCTRAEKRGTLTRTRQNGRVSIAFTGRMDNGRRLKPGKYEAIFRARDAAGNVSTRGKLRFTVVKR